MLIIERGAGHMGMGRSMDVQVDGTSVGRLKQHQSIMVQRDTGEHVVQVWVDDGASEPVRVQLASDHDTRVLVTLYPRLSWRNVVRRRRDAFSFVVRPSGDAVPATTSAHTPP